ncbi:ABC transporter ATP-binding protein [Paenibacillus hamazuiensis]|uniref:ABC transporter ATP-binding protein n=1 Tax=Paenibacillus hamazuiensis TaxID=2936508 RepID=UPI00200F33FC
MELSGLTKKYGDFTAVNKLSLRIGHGEIFGLLGPNGAGKSTTILMMLGLAEPTAGKVRVCGVDPTRQPLLVKRRVGYLPDDVGFYEDRTGLENLLFTARLNRVGAAEALERANQLLELVGLKEAADKKAGTYSRGMRQRLGLADVLIKKPEVIILDEPTLGIDPEGVRELLELIRSLSRNEGITVLLSSHQLHQVQQICDRVGLFVQGSLLAVGTVGELSAQLFAGEPVWIETEIREAQGGGTDGGTEAASLTLTELELSLQQLGGVQTVRRGETGSLSLHIGCERDVSADIARTVLASGFDLLSLSKKQYGLDEIYHRYFEGRKTG